MTQELEQKANEALIKLIDSSTSAVEWSVQQLPEVIEQLLRWKMVTSLIRFSASTVLFLIVIGIVTNLIRLGVKNKLCEDLAIGHIVPSLFISVVAYCSFDLTWLKIHIAPKVYLIEYAAELVK